MMEKANTKDKKIPKSKFYFLLLTSYFSPKKAQTAMELAVFGAILIFVVGLIVRQSLGAGYQQNQNFMAMRLAMKTSYEYSEGLAGGMGPVASRNRASVLAIEDRLTADSSKFGALNRSQYMSAGSATHSRTLNLPVDVNEVENLPVYDVFINGRHFPFSLAGFKTVYLAEQCRGRDGPLFNDCALHPECQNDCGPASVRVFPGRDVAPGNWVDNCAQVIFTRQCRDFRATCLPDCTGASCTADPSCQNCSASSYETYEDERTTGCARLFAKAYNHPANASWCDHDGGPSVNSCDDVCPDPPAVGPAGCNLSADRRFDLDRDGPPPPGSPDPDVPSAERPYFSWQWFEVMGFDEEATQGGGRSRPRTTLSTGEGINFNANGKNTSVDIDGDLKEEVILFETIKRAPDSAVITRFDVLDSQNGDLDFTIGDNENKRPPGLTRDLKMYSFVRPGTYYEIREGSLFGPTDGQFIRNVSQKDQIDLVERVFVLSNNTGRFCSGGTPTDWNNPPQDPACVAGCAGDAACIAACPKVIAGVAQDPVCVAGCSGNAACIAACPKMTNPVEVCNDCFSDANIQATCLDEATLLLFMRSRVSDVRGRKWITPTGGDDYVDFTLPAGP